MNLQNCIISANVNGLKSRAMADKTHNLILKLADFKCDVACLLETCLDEGSEDRLANLWKGSSYFAHVDDPKVAGIAFLVGESVKVDDFHSNGDGRYVAIEFCKLLICAIYAPASSPRARAQFFQQILPDIVLKRKSARKAELVLLGDF